MTGRATFGVLLALMFTGPACVGRDPDASSSERDAAALPTVDAGDAAPTLPAYSELVLGDAPSAYWRFAETSGTLARNSAATGAAYDLTLIGVVPEDFGRPSLLARESSDQALFFSGVSGGSVNLGEVGSALKLVSSFTVEAWVRIPKEGLSTTGTIYSSTSGGADGFTFVLEPSRGLALACHGKQTYATDGLFVPFDDAPHHVVVAWEGESSSATFYVDASPNKITGNPGITIAYAGTTASVAKMPSGSVALRAILDEVAIYPTALASARIAAHRQAGL